MYPLFRMEKVEVEPISATVLGEDEKSVSDDSSLLLIGSDSWKSMNQEPVIEFEFSKVSKLREGLSNDSFDASFHKDENNLEVILVKVDWKFLL